jgi:hypothetical protein
MIVVHLSHILSTPKQEGAPIRPVNEDFDGYFTIRGREGTKAEGKVEKLILWSS